MTEELLYKWMQEEKFENRKLINQQTKILMYGAIIMSFLATANMLLIYLLVSYL